MKADATTEAAIKTVLNRMAQAYATRDMRLLLSICAPDADVVMYGTGADEKRIGLTAIQAQAERDWSQTDSARIVYEWTAVSAAGLVAWVAADAAFELTMSGESMRFPARITAVFEQRNGQWLMVQSHFSLPAMGQGDDEAFPQ